MRNHSRILRVAFLAVIAFFVTLYSGCGGGGSSGGSTSSAPSASGSGGSGSGGSGTGGGGSTGTSSQFNRVFLVVLENISYADVAGSPDMPYLNSLAQHYAVAANYYANTHPSIGNYFMMTTGQIVTNDDAFAGTVSADNIVRQLTAAGKSWKVYAESLPSAGYTGSDVYPYMKHHNPFAYFSDVAGGPGAANLLPYSSFAADLSAGNLANFVFILPNAKSDMHDCPSGMGGVCTLAEKQRYGDAWLQANLSPILASSAFTNGGLLIVNFDESYDTDKVNGGGHVLTVLVSPKAKPGYSSSTMYQHESLLRLMLEGLGVTNLPGAAASAPKMSEFFQ